MEPQREKCSCTPTFDGCVSTGTLHGTSQDATFKRCPGKDPRRCALAQCQRTVVGDVDVWRVDWRVVAQDSHTAFIESVVR